AYPKNTSEVSEDFGSVLVFGYLSNLRKPPAVQSSVHCRTHCRWSDPGRTSGSNRNRPGSSLPPRQPATDSCSPSANVPVPPGASPGMLQHRIPGQSCCDCCCRECRSG